MQELVRMIVDSFPLTPLGIHGVTHWARVYENGMRIASENGADESVIAFFAVFHDSQRFSNGTDPEHGKRGAELALRFRDEHYSVSDQQFELLYHACCHHTHEASHPDITIQTCYDADRLDLARVGITPDPNRLCTTAARSKTVLSWAIQRGDQKYVPREVLSNWNVEQLLL